MSIVDLFRLDGRVAIVTGGATHLGNQMARTLAELGAIVWIASRDSSGCEAAAEAMCADGFDCHAARVDVTDEADVEGLVDRVVARHGTVDIMVCNAGGATSKSAIKSSFIETGEEFRSAIDVNLMGTFHSAAAAARPMIAQKRGAIITLGSIHAVLGIDRRWTEGLARSGSSYRAAKGGILNLTRSMACELGEHGIRVNCISPGRIPQDPDGDFDREFADRSPLRRVGRAQDVKGAVALLASDAGGWITGQNLMVDGGWSAW